MKHRLLILTMLGLISFSCRRDVIIPKEVMVDIYHDMYLLDQYLMKHDRDRSIQDSLNIYNPIFEKYGYTLDDYTASVNIYLKRPDKFEKVFNEVKSRYRARMNFIEDSLAKVQRKAFRWSLSDSVRALGTDSISTTLLYRALDMLFYRQDTTFLTEYPLPDSAVLASYKLNAFELYGGNPFSTKPYPGRWLVMLPDTASKITADTLTVPEKKKAKSWKQEIHRKTE